MSDSNAEVKQKAREVIRLLSPSMRLNDVRRSEIETHVEAVGGDDALRAELNRAFEAIALEISEDFEEAATPRVTSAAGGGRTSPDESPRLKAAEPRSPAPRRTSPPRDPIEVARRRLRADLELSEAHLSKVLLTAEEEVGLTLLLRPDGEPLDSGEFASLRGERAAAASAMLLHNMGLIHSVAQKYAPPGMEYDDLVQSGVVGLIRAIEMFDPSRGLKFSTYALNWVQQSVRRAIANESRLIRLPVHMYDRVLKVFRVRDQMSANGIPPSRSSLARACDLSVRQIEEYLALGRHDVNSLDALVGTDREATLADLVVEVDPGPSPYSLAFRKLLTEQIYAVLDTLGERESDILAKRSGIGVDEPMTLDEIGKHFGVSRERIRQIEKKAMIKLRHPEVVAVLRPYL